MATHPDVDYEFVEELPEELTCSICMKLLCQPHMVNCCGQQFCEDCLKHWQQQKRTCPHCRGTDFSHMLMKQTSRKIGELKIYCPNKKHGCESILKISEYDDHLSTANSKGCQYVLVHCPYNCAHQLNIHRCQLEEHKESQCPRRPFSCVHCKLEGEHKVITGDHLKTCPSYPLACPQQCGATVLRKDLKAHKDICPEELVACPYSELGCKVKVQRKDLEKHVETSAVQHMTVLAQSHLSLKAEHAALKDEHAVLKDEHATLKKSHADMNTRLNAAGAQLKDVRKTKRSVADCVAKMYPILVDTSELTMNTGLVLSLSETNMESGHHYIIVSKYKFKLEWQKQVKHVLQIFPGPAQVELKLYLVVDDIYPTIAKSWSCDVFVKNLTQKLAVICSGKPVAVAPHQKEARAGYMLLGTIKRDFLSSSIDIQFSTHDSIRCESCCGSQHLVASYLH